MTKSHYELLMADPGFRRAIAGEALAEDAAELISRLMVEQNLSKADLAVKLGISLARATKLLTGEANMKIREFGEFVHALNAEVELSTNLQRANRPFGPHDHS